MRIRLGMIKYQDGYVIGSDEDRPLTKEEGQRIIDRSNLAEIIADYLSKVDKDKGGTGHGLRFYDLDDISEGIVGIIRDHTRRLVDRERELLSFPSCEGLE